MNPLLIAAVLGSACQKPNDAPLTPDLHGWKEEGELVVTGLAEVKALWKQGQPEPGTREDTPNRRGQRDAARKLAEQVYTERWEPRLERAAMQLDSKLARQTEYEFGLLFIELEGHGVHDRVDERIRTVDERVEAASRAAEKAFPAPGLAGSPAFAAGDAPTRPIVPAVAPAWEDAPP
ncbi:MAG: hypothetical protein EXR69_08750 [Myxococcales bacterium]|nr:hypothetical protein [Myxococcales bacterium]